MRVGWLVWVLWLVLPPPPRGPFSQNFVEVLLFRRRRRGEGGREGGKENESGFVVEEKEVS